MKNSMLGIRHCKGVLISILAVFGVPGPPVGEIYD